VEWGWGHGQLEGWGFRRRGKCNMSGCKFGGRVSGAAGLCGCGMGSYVRRGHGQMEGRDF
jgi:hypothetical protein